MQETLRGADAARLERSCGRRDWIRPGTGAGGIERAEAYFSTHAFEPHRHDTYAIGVTCAGIQTFRYRGRRRIALPGQIHVLHPDETHDGAPATDEGFRYRIAYIEPELIRRALDDGPLPFVAEPVQDRTPVTGPLAAIVRDIDEPVDDLARSEIAAGAADTLRALTGARLPSAPIDLRMVELVREYLAAHAREQTPAAVLERVAGSDRFTIARHFRRAFGTSPDRYRTMRRLELARAALGRGSTPAEAAVAAGFADQSHLTRQFKRAFGLTPGRWSAAVVNGSARTGGLR